MSKKSKEKKLNNLLNELEEVSKTIEELKINPIVVQYEQLKLRKVELDEQRFALGIDISVDKMKRCGAHYFVGNYKGFYCMKCGFATKQLFIAAKYMEKQAMYKYVRECNFDDESINCNYIIDVGLAKKIYSRILEANPGIDHKTAIKYFEIALDNMIDIETPYERVISRAKRLGVQTSKIRTISRNISKRN